MIKFDMANSRKEDKIWCGDHKILKKHGRFQPLCFWLSTDEFNGIRGRGLRKFNPTVAGCSIVHIKRSLWGSSFPLLSHFTVLCLCSPSPVMFWCGALLVVLCFVWTWMLLYVVYVCVCLWLLVVCLYCDGEREHQHRYLHLQVQVSMIRRWGE